MKKITDLSKELPYVSVYVGGHHYNESGYEQTFPEGCWATLIEVEKPSYKVPQSRTIPVVYEYGRSSAIFEYNDSFGYGVYKLTYEGQEVYVNIITHG